MLSIRSLLGLALLGNCILALNFVYIVVDDFGWNDVRWRGATDAQTPRLSQLKDEALEFTRMYGAPRCSPTRTQLMTGRYANKVGIQSGNIPPMLAFGLPLNVPLISTELAAAGYHNYMIGKWHLGWYDWDYTPTHRGFHNFSGTYQGSLIKYTGVNEFDVDEVTYSGIDLRCEEEPAELEGAYISDWLYARFSDYLDAHIAHEPNTPFYFQFNFDLCHIPIDPPNDMLPHFEGDSIYTNNPLRRDYLAMVRKVDQIVGFIVDDLKDAGYWDDTILWLSSDNGASLHDTESSSYPLRGGKTSLYEGGVRLNSLIAGGPIHRSRLGNTYDGIVSVTDVLPTFLAMAGLEYSGRRRDLDGFDISRVLTRRRGATRRTEVLLNEDSNPHNCGTLDDEGNLLCGGLIQRNWKLVIGYEGSSRSEDRTGWTERPLQSELAASSINSPVSPTVKCSDSIPQPTFEEARMGCPYDGTGCLFDLDSDPCEYLDVKLDFPNRYTAMMTALKEHRDGAVAALRPVAESIGFYEDAADPDNFDGWWCPWWYPGIPPPK